MFFIKGIWYLFDSIFGGSVDNLVRDMLKILNEFLICLQSPTLVWMLKPKFKSWTDFEFKGFILVTSHFPVHIVIENFLRKVWLKGTKEPILERNLFLVSTAIKDFPEKILWLITLEGIQRKNLSVNIVARNFYSRNPWKNTKIMFARWNHKQPRASMQNLEKWNKVMVRKSQK